MVELDCGSPCPAAVSYGSSLKGGNLSIGLVMDCEIDVFAGICNSGGRVEERRPVPVTTVVVMSQSAVFATGRVLKRFHFQDEGKTEKLAYRSFPKRAARKEAVALMLRNSPLISKK